MRGDVDEASNKEASSPKGAKARKVRWGEYFRTFIVPSYPSRDIDRGRLMLHWNLAYDAAGAVAGFEVQPAADPESEGGTDSDNGAFVPTYRASGCIRLLYTSHGRP